MSKTGLEQRDAAAAAVAIAPRVTLVQIESLVLDEEYFISKRKVTICVLTLKNGFKTTGVSAAVSLDNFNEDLGKKIAREKAVGEIWPLAAYLLQETLHQGAQPAVMRCKVTLQSKTPNVHLQHHQPKGRLIEHPHSSGEAYTAPDPQDPANYVQDGVGLSFCAVWGGQDPEDGKNACRENRIFSDATPSLHFSAVVRNAAVTAMLEVGRDYYVDFIPAGSGQ